MRSPRIVEHRLDTKAPVASCSSALETPTKSFSPVIVIRVRIRTVPVGSPLSLKSCSTKVQANSLPCRCTQVPCCLLAALRASEPIRAPPRAQVAYARKDGGGGTPGGTAGEMVTIQEPSIHSDLASVVFARVCFSIIWSSDCAQLTPAGMKRAATTRFNANMLAIIDFCVLIWSPLVCAGDGLQSSPASFSNAVFAAATKIRKTFTLTYRNEKPQ